MFSTPLCQVCQSIDFDKAFCCPGDGGAPFQTWGSLRASAHSGCELCILIEREHDEHGRKGLESDEKMLCCVWNYYEGEKERFRGSARIIFFNSSQAIRLGIFVDEGDGFLSSYSSVKCSDLAKANIISGRPAGQNAKSKHHFSLIQAWIKECTDHHSLSCPSEAASLPTRVIDVGSSLQEPYLYVSNNEIGAWIALSHCWGTDIPFVTNTENIDDRRKKIMLGDVPKSFRDAIVITRELGYRYLWIDSLCILQDSADDWAFEASRMQHYYKCSMLTIAVDLATGDREGFLENPRQSDFIKVKVPFKTQRVSSPAYAFVGNKIKDDLDIYQSQSPLSQRAWTLQEDLLSPRSIHYADNQLVWECQKNMLTETDSTPLGTYDLATPRLFKRYFLKPFCMLTDPLVLRYPSYSKIYTTLDRWYRIFENYSNRLLTFEDDRFNAISGVAKELQQQSLMTYKAGIWLEDFRIGLLWIVEGRGMPASHYYAPSWSWASLKIKKHWGTSINLIFELYYRVRNLELDSKGENCELLSCTVGPATDDPFGRLLSGVIRLKGRWMPYSCWSVNTPTYFNTYWLKAKSHVATRGIGFPDRPDQLICSFDWEPDDSDIEEDEVDEFQGGTNEDEDVNTKAEENSRESYVWNEEILQNASLFQIGKFTYKASGDGESRSVIYALILISAGDSDTFRRIGVAEVPDVDEQGNTGWQTRDVSII